MYEIINTTYSPLRVIVNGFDKVLPGRPVKNRKIFVKELNLQLRKMRKNGLIKVKKI